MFGRWCASVALAFIFLGQAMAQNSTIEGQIRRASSFAANGSQRLTVDERGSSYRTTRRAFQELNDPGQSQQQDEPFVDPRPFEVERLEQEDLDPEVIDIAEQRRETLKDWPRIAIQDIKINPRDMAEKIPSDRADRLIQRYARNWGEFETTFKHYCWESPNLRYQPLYFEHVALERYGQRFINDYWETAASGAHYFTSLLLLPLHMRQDPIFSCDYPLGYCRPGVCSDRIFQRQFWGWYR